MNDIETPLIEYMRSIFEEKRSRNKRYSLRAFARDLNVSASKLSEMFSGKYAPGIKTIDRICKALEFDDTQKAHFTELARDHEITLSERAGAYLLTEDELDLIADFEYYSLLALMETDQFQSKPDWMAQRLGISTEKVREILDCLARMGLIMYSADEYQPSYRKMTTSHNIPSEVLRQAHRQLIDHAKTSLDHVPVELRDITSITFAIDQNKLSEAKEVLRDCRRKIAELSGEGPKSEVYNLNIQLVPVTRLQSSEKGSHEVRL